jgi:hypothetical protein
MDPRLQLSAQTVAWLADRPYDRKFVRSIGNKLTDPELAGHHLDAIATLRVILSDHQFPTRTGRCRTCRRHTWRRLWRRRRFPCGGLVHHRPRAAGTVHRHRPPPQTGHTTPTRDRCPDTSGSPARASGQTDSPHQRGGHPPSCRDDHGDNEVPGARAVA